MKHITLKLNSIAMSGNYLHDSLKPNQTIDFELKKPDQTLQIILKAPVIGSITLDLDFVEYDAGALRMHILSSRSFLRPLLMLLNLFGIDMDALHINYPILTLDMEKIVKNINPNAECLSVSMVGQEFIIEVGVQ